MLRPCAGSDIGHDDPVAPSQPGCSNSFVLVKIRNWIKGQEEPEVVGVSARFGKAVSDHEEQKHSVPLAKLNPEDACTDSLKPMQGYATLVRRGNCDFTTKARVAQKAGAVVVLVVNDKQGYAVPHEVPHEEAGGEKNRKRCSKKSQAGGTVGGANGEAGCEKKRRDWTDEEIELLLKAVPWKAAA